MKFRCWGQRIDKFTTTIKFHVLMNIYTRVCARVRACARTRIVKNVIYFWKFHENHQKIAKNRLLEPKKQGS